MEKIKKFKMFGIGFTVFLLMLATVAPTVWAWTLDEWKARKVPTLDEWRSEKDLNDDPRPILKTGLNPKKYLPPDVYDKVTFDVETMKRVWADLVGFKAPDETGKIAPEIIPGTYSYHDKDKFPFKELMIPHHYQKFAPGAPPFIGNFPVIKVVPTRQYYYSLAISQATKENMGRTELNDKGFLNVSSLQPGVPFPRPSGKFKAQQAIYNWLLRYEFSNSAGLIVIQGFNKKLGLDWFALNDQYQLRVAARIFEPKGWYDERARKRKEKFLYILRFLSPQDSIGNVIAQIHYLDPSDYNQSFLYFNQIRRIRKLSAEDTQDPWPGADQILDDSYLFSVNLSPTRFPYKYEIIAEREYLVPTFTSDGSQFFTSKSGVELHNVEFERRPVYVLQLTQQDPNYVYSKRIMYMDKETFNIFYVENFDKKGRLYRTGENIFGFYPEQGWFTWLYDVMADHVDTHSTLLHGYFDQFTFWLTREDCSVGRLTKIGK
ncbi:MAG: DUF1329 domain-containing protein [Thermodesulfobacteriota bacterium]